MTERPKPLPLVPPPLAGECLGSWLSRVATVYDVSVADLLRHCGVEHRGANSAGIKLDELPAATLRVLAVRLRTATSRLQSMNACTWSVTLRAGELGFCPQCFCEDDVQARPAHWRRAWLDAFSTACDRHRAPLLAVRPDTLAQARNWGRLRVLLHAPLLRYERSHIHGGFALSALPLQFAVLDQMPTQQMRKRYALSNSTQVRQVATDLLDILLAPDRYLRHGSPLVRMACLQGQNEWLSHLTVLGTSKSRLISRVKILGARCFALAIVESLMFQSAHTLVQGPGTLLSARALREDWLWVFMPTTTLFRLRRRSKSWPQGYAKQCWPELNDPITPTMLHRTTTVRFPMTSTRTIYEATLP